MAKAGYRNSLREKITINEQLYFQVEKDRAGDDLYRHYSLSFGLIISVIDSNIVYFI